MYVVYTLSAMKELGASNMRLHESDPLVCVRVPFLLARGEDETKGDGEKIVL